MRARVRVRVLGSTEAVLGDEGVDLGGPKQRLVLSVLVAARGRAVPMERLVDGLWDDDPPNRAEASIQAYVSNLRRALEPGRARGTASQVLALTPGGYRLELDALDVDARRFEALAEEGHLRLAEGDPAAAQAALAEALALWRGAAFGEASSTASSRARWRRPRLTSCQGST